MSVETHDLLARKQNKRVKTCLKKKKKAEDPSESSWYRATPSMPCRGSMYVLCVVVVPGRDDMLCAVFRHAVRSELTN